MNPSLQGQEFDGEFGGELAFGGHESHSAIWGESGNHIATEMSTHSSDNRGLDTGRPRLARVKVGTDSCLISKQCISILPSLHSANLRIFLFDPLLNECAILLESPPEQPLRAEAELIQQGANRGFVKADWVSRL